MGFLICGVFFFLSGYGLQTSLKVKTNYIEKFPKKILKVIIDFVIAYVVYTIFYIATKTKYNIFNPVLNSWFIYELVIFYIIFWMVNKLVKMKNTSIGISMLIIVFLGIMFYLEIKEYWYKSALGFVYGIIIAENKEKFISYFNNKFLLKIMLNIFALSASLVMGKFLNLNVLNVLLYNISCILFTTIIIMILYKFNTMNRFNGLSIIGNISMEIYLYHGLVIWIMDKGGINKYLNCILVPIISLVISYAMHNFNIINNKK